MAGESEVTEGRQPSWVRYLVPIAAAVALLLFGAAAGLLIKVPGAPTDTTPGPDSVDVGFAQDMSVHHEQAVQMATWERDHTTEPALRQLAFDIESTQSRQIGHMQGWLGLWSAATQSSGRYMRWMPMPSARPGPGMTGAGSSGVDRMPGMATDEELRRLRTSTGQPMDVLFLQLMLRHHEGGTDMLSYAAAHAEQPDVRNLAGQMLTSQRSEADYLRQLLAQHGAAPLPST